MNKKHILFPYLGIFQPPSLPQIFPLLPTSPFLPLSPHFLFTLSGELSSLSSSKLLETRNTRLEEGEKFNVEGRWRGEGKRNASSQMQKWEKKGKLPPFSTFFLMF